MIYGVSLQSQFCHDGSKFRENDFTTLLSHKKFCENGNFHVKDYYIALQLKDSTILSNIIEILRTFAKKTAFFATFFPTSVVAIQYHVFSKYHES